MDGWGPEPRKPDVGEGDLVGIEDVIGLFGNVSEAYSESDERETWIHGSRDQTFDQSVDGLPDGLDGVDGGVDDGMNVQRSRSIGDGGNEPIEIDPHEIPPRDINGIRETVPQFTAGLVMRVGGATAS